MTSQEIKVGLINAACQLAAASVGSFPTVDGTPVQPDSLVHDVGLQKKNVLLYEESKIFYAALLRAFQDQSGVWPDPQLPAGAVGVDVSTPAAQVSVLTNLVKGAASGSPVLTLATQLLGLLQGGPVQAPVPAAPVPMPGSDIPAPSPSSPVTPAPVATAK